MFSGFYSFCLRFLFHFFTGAFVFFLKFLKFLFGYFGGVLELFDVF